MAKTRYQPSGDKLRICKIRAKLRYHKKKNKILKALEADFYHKFNPAENTDFIE